MSACDLPNKSKDKRKRPSATAMRQKDEDKTISRDVPLEERLCNEDSLKIGLASQHEEKKERWRKAPYCWNARGFLYESYYYLTEKRDVTTNEYV